MMVGIVHPGAMGTSIGAALVGNGHPVGWASHGRSAATRQRAETDGLVDHAHEAVLVDECTTIISVCPPDQATTVATQIASLGFAGTYVDANAIAPATSRTIAAIMAANGATFVDGGIVGPPARHRGLTVLYLSGPPDSCAGVADLFTDSPLITHLLVGPAGAASAVKMAFAAWTKGTSALLLAIRALAESEGVVDGLDHAWSVLTPDLPQQLAAVVRGSAPKAWRFVGEMQEVAATFVDAGLPPGFHQAAAEIYGELDDLRDRPEVGLDDIVSRLLSRGS